MAVSIKLKNVDSTFNGINKEFNKLVNSAQRISAFQATSDLKVVTPVDKGRARGSWALSKIERDFKDAQYSVVSNSYLGPIPNDKIESIYITNGTPYIQDLNQGSSLQAPPRFIEKTISKYFKTKGNIVRTF
jgi:hypothetical protein